MMEQENNPESAEQPCERPAPSVGQRLREARERQGLSVDDVVAKIKLAPRQIIALEADDFDALPQTAFVRGFVRSYAKLLQLDAQQLLDALPGGEVAKVSAEIEKVEAPFPSERTARRQNLNLLVAALLVTVVIAGFALWQSNAPVQVEAPAAPAAQDELVATPLPLPERLEVLDAASEVQAASAVPQEVAASAVAPAAPPASAVQPAFTRFAASAVPTASAVQPSGKSAALRLVFDKDAWVEVRDRYGKTLSNQVNHSGTELRVEGIPPFAMVVGHATSVHLYYRDKPVDMTPYVNASSEVARLTLE